MTCVGDGGGGVILTLCCTDDDDCVQHKVHKVPINSGHWQVLALPIALYSGRMKMERGKSCHCRKKLSTLSSLRQHCRYKNINILSSLLFDILDLFCE